MFDSIFIDKLLEKEGLSLVSESMQKEENIFDSLVWRTYDDRGRANPNNTKLKEISEKIKKEHGCLINFIDIDKDSNNLDTKLREYLLNIEKNLIEDAHSLISKNKTIIWIKTKEKLTETSKDKIEYLIDEYLEKYKIKSFSAYFSRMETLPEKIVILRAIHILSPCSITDLIKELENRKFEISNKEWLINEVNEICKIGSIIKLSGGIYDGNYILSLKGLSIIGTARNKKSPDIKRVLAIPRKKG